MTESAQPIPPAPDGSLHQQAGKFALVGVASTLLHLGLFALLHVLGLPAQGANLAALILATLFNTSANRRWTFGVKGSANAAKHHAQGLAIFVLTWAVTAGGLALLDVLVPDASVVLSTAALGFATAVSTVVRFVAMRFWMFRST